MLHTPLPILFALQQDAYIFLVGSSGSTCTTLCFLYVLWEFPRFLKHVKSEGADPVVVVRLATFYNLNVSAVTNPQIGRESTNLTQAREGGALLRAVVGVEYDDARVHPAFALPRNAAADL